VPNDAGASIAQVAVLDPTADGRPPDVAAAFASSFGVDVPRDRPISTGVLRFALSQMLGFEDNETTFQYGDK
jgi:hypothetical protein